MMKKIIKLIKKLLVKLNYCLYLGSTDILPPPLSKEEEIHYVELSMDGDQEARNKLIEHNLRLVAHIVKKYDHKREDVDDLISIGTIGLIKGVDSFSNSHEQK